MHSAGSFAAVSAVCCALAAEPAACRTAEAKLTVTASVPGTCAVSVAPGATAATAFVTCANVLPQSVGVAAAAAEGFFVSAETGAVNGPTRTLTVRRRPAGSISDTLRVVVTY